MHGPYSTIIRNVTSCEKNPIFYHKWLPPPPPTTLPRTPAPLHPSSPSPPPHPTFSPVLPPLSPTPSHPTLSRTPIIPLGPINPNFAAGNSQGIPHVRDQDVQNIYERLRLSNSRREQVH